MDAMDGIRRMRWVRWVPLVVTPVLLLASTYPERFHVTPLYWVLSLLAAAIFAVGERYPLATSLAVSVIGGVLLTQEAWGMSGLVPYLAVIALLDLAARGRDGRAIALGAVVWAGAVTVDALTDPYGRSGPAQLAVQLLAYVGLPLAAGLYLRSRIQLAEQDRRRIAAELTGAQQTERAALARELHDLVAHHMAAIIMRVGVARTRTADAQSKAVLDDVHETASQALGNIRSLLTAIRTDQVGSPTEIDDVRGELRDAVQRTRAAGFAVTDSVDLSGEALDAIGSLTLVRVTQEALTNVMKHAAPGTAVSLTVAQTPTEVIARIHSDLPEPHGNRGAGHGLDGMAERARLAGGILDAGPVDGGWSVRLVVPTREARQ
ncbi:histidine kinase OS=Tsukamurella paurometabola (strain ATCC 8368 / DSM / CCUG 35730 / CIP 100753/ JCM 10117 / KCTC 9821 / NBRC 16120 / NCIMB 702349 / NCTC 13040) OX=521096 GN=Tpau_3508 PE=4 SV=1 [Tsukamurella paurometabola]|uniref:histidine kinase n=1 Tax=Tsukamurella paurometabola (strain ATCC 8368 / DSM 20162 / CCUG 35730 / CIP 100753 / JCM 10117 / KCTC 9821 / NBRC 16120 / NCIMB 702349 / NCTC 13040) TaxID=521096 RepID=D5UX68_TSUPD|nr:histidine kinase [Tsukamurella paurometabola]ADG80087.1 integral membrane sensor signal transduction histidine kinase [Tsukamurella paurometabola DSM 20162]SUP38366.1 Sensor histidine kinase desK [Tsukamurella paurometabola]